MQDVLHFRVNSFPKSDVKRRGHYPVRNHAICHGESPRVAHNNRFSSQGTRSRVSSEGPVETNQHTRRGPSQEMRSKFQLGVLGAHFSPSGHRSFILGFMSPISNLLCLFTLPSLSFFFSVFLFPILALILPFVLLLYLKSLVTGWSTAALCCTWSLSLFRVKIYMSRSCSSSVFSAILTSS